MPSPGAGGVQTSLVGRVQSMMATARSGLRRKPDGAVPSTMPRCAMNWVRGHGPRRGTCCSSG